MWPDHYSLFYIGLGKIWFGTLTIIAVQTSIQFRVVMIGDNDDFLDLLKFKTTTLKPVRISPYINRFKQIKLSIITHPKLMSVGKSEQKLCCQCTRPYFSRPNTKERISMKVYVKMYYFHF